MTEPIDEQPLTLAMRLEDETRSVTDRDLERISGFLHQTLGQWYDVKPGGTPPSVEPSDIIITVQPVTGSNSAESALLDPGDSLGLAPSVASTNGDKPDADEADDSAEADDTAETDEAEDDAEADDDADDSAEADDDAEADDSAEADDTAGGGTPDERDGVFDACATLAQVAVGRVRTSDESWDDVVRLMEADQRPALASALWVGLAAEPGLRYRSIEQWRRSVDAALRSDAATATMLFEDDERRRSVPIVVAAAVVAAIAAGAFVFLRNDVTVEDAGVADTGPPEATTEETDEPPSPSEATTTSTGGSSAFDRVEGAGDPCALVGSLGPITVDEVSDTAIVISWPPSTEAVNILLDGSFVDTVPAEAFRYVIERQPLSGEPLLPDTEYLVAVQAQPGDPSTACTKTLANPVPGSEFLIGVTAPTGFEVVETSARSITVRWDPRPGADLHNLYLDGSYVRYGEVGGSSAIGDEAEFTFVDLEPDTTYEIGIRRVEGPNQSGLVSVTASTDPE